ncbi:MAG TPA: carbamoyltransferase HypF [Cellvibrio sp.]|nr:carbamoyltransferase HypF [Cellvibrio sp.]
MVNIALENHEVRVRGTVQGVGFRPTVYRLAVECRLTGEVFNDTDGVFIRLSGIQTDIREFLQRLENESPSLARIESIESTAIAAQWCYHNFHISQSSASQGRTDVAPDAATCKSCLEEIFNPAERRYLYPFTNCTHCGPRLSIIQGIPYDRRNTTMANFNLCAACEAEYNNPLDRRFHAQPVACHQCGPGLFLHHFSGESPNLYGDRKQQTRQIFQDVVDALQDGKIVAIKGLGGFHLCCDATNHFAVSRLRERKQRYAKPFALMCNSIDRIRGYCQISEQEQIALTSSAAPIVLLQKHAELQSINTLSTAIAPGTHLLGFMLPYTPLHHLLCQDFGKPLVMTSGNVAGEPQIIDNEEALDKLGDIADLMVYHDRDIANRIDDSVVRCVGGKISVIRRARGYAPRSISLPKGFEQAGNIIAYGAELKSTFCLVKQGAAILSQHQGDLEDATTAADFEKNLQLYQQIFSCEPRYLIADKHPEYLSSKFARRDASTQHLDLMEVQHHHAHIASAMAENNLPLDHPPVLGIALDGLGLGDNNEFWGGEFLLSTYRDYRRLALLKPVAMPGASQAIKQPWRNTYAQICNSMSWETFTALYNNTSLANLLTSKPLPTLHAMLSQGINCPLSSSMGRLFDAVAGALGLCAEQVYFEGQAAIELEMVTDAAAVLNNTIDRPYALRLEQITDTQGNRLLQLNPASSWPALLNDIQHQQSISVIATRFHRGLIDSIAHLIKQLQKEFTFTDVVLSGGCFQNAILLQGLERALDQQQLRCITHADVPANDGGIALGQAVIAAARKS